MSAATPPSSTAGITPGGVAHLVRANAALIAGEVGTFEWDVVSDRLWGDENFARMFGIPLDAGGAARLGDYLAVIHADDRGVVAERVQRTVDTGCDYDAEYRIITGGPPRWVVARGKIERDEAGRAARFPGVVLDVTDRKRAEQLLEAQNRAMELVATGAPLAEALGALTNVVEEQSGGQSLASILIVERDGRSLRTGAAPSLPPEYNAAIDGIKAEPGVGTCAEAAALDAVVCTPDIAAAPSWRGLSHLPLSLGLKGAWSMPIRASNARVIGTFGTYFRECREPTERERQVVAGLCRVAALAIERRRAEEANQRLAAMVRSSCDAILSVGLDGTIQTWNRGAEQLFGYTQDEAVGQPITILAVPQRPDEPDVIFERVRRGESVTGLETVRARKDGSAVDVSISVDPVFDIGGRVMSMVGVVRDITERRRGEEALRESDERARLLVDAARQLGSSLDPKAIYARLRETVRGAMPLGGLVVSSYDAAEGLIRCAYAWVSGKELDPASLPPLRFNPAGGGMQTQVILTGRPLLFNDVVERVKDPRGTFYEVNPDGSMRNLPRSGPTNVRSAVMVPVLSEGAVTGVVQVMSNSEQAYTSRDLALLEGITLQLGVALENARLYRRVHEELEERKRIEVRLREAKEAAESASRAKGEFLATLSHELRTPLTPVLLTVSLMESHPGLPEDLRADVATIRRNVELESRLISDLLDLTRIERGKIQMDEQDVDLHLIVRSAIDICQREASAKPTVDLAAERHTVCGDSTRLQQVFWNLINNAIKFTPQDGTITVRSRNTDDGRVRVEVVDNGAGIDPALLPRLFSAFEQGEVRAARQQAGLGLGLTISKKLAEAHGGTITVTSEGRGRGATFAVDLPVVDQFVRAAPVPARPALVRKAAQPLNVLVVEDNAPTLRVLERLLCQIGHRVTGVTSVAAAIAAATNDAFDLIISDLGLPDGSGLDVIRRLRHDYAGPAIALTGYGMDADVAASRTAGFAEHLTKPVDLAQLEAAIGRVTPADPVF